MTSTIKKWIRIIIIAVCIIYSLFMIITVILASSYSVLAADDFSHGINVGEFRTGFWSYLAASFRYAGRTYMIWQGTFFSMFIQALLSPINHFGAPQLKWVMVFNSSLFFASLFYLLIVMMKKTEIKDLMIKCVIVTVCLFSFCGYDAYPEIFFWFSGATSYSIPFSLLMIAVAHYIQAGTSTNIAYLISAMLLGFLSMGGTLMVAGTGCYVALLIVMYRIIYSRKSGTPIAKKNIIIFFIWLAGAIINAFAPGNFVRHSVIDDTGVHPIAAIRYALIMAAKRCKFLLTMNFPVLLIIVFICGMFMMRKKKADSLHIVISLLGLGTPLIAAFPVALGYSNNTLVNRCAFIIDATIILSALFFSFILGAFITSRLDKRAINPVIISVTCLGLLCVLFDRYGFSDVKVWEQARQLSDRTYQDHYDSCNTFLDSLSNYAEGEDVRIPKTEFPYEIDNCYNFYLSEDPSDWINSAVAEYYGLNSIAINPE